MSEPTLNRQMNERIEAAKKALGQKYILHPQYQSRKPFPVSESRVLAPVLAKARKAGRI